MTAQEQEATDRIGNLILDFIETARWKSISKEHQAESLQSMAVHLFNAIRAPLYEQAAEQSRHIQTLETMMQVQEAKLAALEARLQ